MRAWPQIVLVVCTACFITSPHLTPAAPAQTDLSLSSSNTPPVRPKLDEITLEYHGQRLKPVYTFTPWIPEFQADAVLLAIRNDTVIALNPANHERLWESNNPTDGNLQWQCVQDGIAYFSPVPANRWEEGSKRPARILRLNLKTRDWLKPLSIPERDKGESILSAIASDDYVVVLSKTTITEQIFSERLKSYRISCFETASGKLKWSKFFPALEENGPPSAYLLSSVRPNEAIANIRNLSWLGGDILVCAGPRQNLIRIATATGEIKWVEERLWEFERGFIGPSVWSHFIARFAQKESLFGNQKINPQDVKKFDEQWRCNIIGGPIIIDHKSTDYPGNGKRIFVVAAKGPGDRERANWSSYLSDCVIYELDDSGSPISMATLPRTTIGSQVQIQTNAVIWNCQNNAMVRVGTSEGRAMEGPGSADLLTKISWYREYESDVPQAWLVSDKAGEVVGFGNSKAARVLSGGYVNEERGSEYHFPLSLIEYVNGTTQSFVLHVPLTGEVPRPVTNYSGSGRHFHARGPYFLSVLGLKIEGTKLSIIFGMEKWTGVATFQLEALK